MKQVERNNSELQPIPRSVTFTPPEHAPEGVSHLVSTINDAMRGLTSITRWTEGTEERLSEPGAPSISEVSDKATICRNLLSAIHDSMADQQDSPMIRPLTNQLLEAEHAVPQNSESAFDAIYELNTMEDALSTVWKIRGACHTMEGIIGLIRSNADRPSNHEKITIQRLQEEFHRLGESHDNLLQELVNTYPIQELSVYDVIFRPFIRIRGVNINIHDAEWAHSRSVVQWSNAWYESLLVNIGQNIIRSGSQNLEVSAQKTSDNDGRWIDIFFDDDGADPDPDIVVNGFQRGASHFDGMGIGMAHHAEVIQEHYGGNLTLEYRTNPKGNVLKGARVHLRLPSA